MLLTTWFVIIKIIMGVTNSRQLKRRKWAVREKSNLEATQKLKINRRKF